MLGELHENPRTGRRHRRHRDRGAAAPVL